MTRKPTSKTASKAMYDYQMKRSINKIIGPYMYHPRVIDCIKSAFLAGRRQGAAMARKGVKP